MSFTASKAGIVSFEEARHIVEHHAAELFAALRDSRPTEIVDLPHARGRVSAEPILADRDFPPFPRATRDGYAVRAADLERVPARLEVVGEIKAGDSEDILPLKAGQAVSIMTGAAVPPGADAVVMVEYTLAREFPADVLGPHHAKDRRGGSSYPESATLRWGNLGVQVIEVQRSVASGENLVPRGAEARVGQVLADKGRRLDHALIGMAAAVGKNRVRVFRKPRVAVLATGNEVVEIDVAPGAVQIRNSNSYSLAAQIEGAGGEAVRLEIAPDEPKRLRQLIEQGLECDLLLITGGVSMGKYDLVEQVLGEMNAEFYFTGARIQPGKPVVFGSCLCGADTLVRAGSSPAADTRAGARAPSYFFGLPGNPVSTMVTFRLFAQPIIAAVAGAQPEPLYFLKARLKSEVRTKTGLTRFLPAVISGMIENVEVELAIWQGSGDIAALARANCYLVVPPDRERIEAGEWVSVLPT